MAILEVRGLIKRFGRRQVVDGVDFEVNVGEVVGLLGPNGAGKTTSFRMTTGQITPNAGSVIFDGQDVTELPMYRRARLGMGYLSQEQSVFRKLTVEQNIMAILEALPTSRGLGRKLRRAERWERTEKALEQFGLTHIRHTPAGRASGGEKRRLEIARCLVCEPLLILLDEPFAGVDPITKAEIRQTVADLVKTQPIGILLTDHDIHEVLKVTNRSYLIKDGKVRMHGTPEEWVRNPIAVNEYLGTTFSDNGIGTAPTEGRALKAAQWSASQAHARVNEPASIPVSAVLEQERIHRLIEELRNDDQARSAAQELAGKGNVALPALLDALDRREPELRQRAAVVVQSLVGSPLAFDPVGPEAMRRQQLSALRTALERKAG